jgi:hypothetical protein
MRIHYINAMPAVHGERKLCTEGFSAGPCRGEYEQIGIVGRELEACALPAVQQDAPHAHGILVERDPHAREFIEQFSRPLIAGLGRVDDGPVPQEDIGRRGLAVGERDTSDDSGRGGRSACRAY